VFCLLTVFSNSSRSAARRAVHRIHSHGRAFCTAVASLSFTVIEIIGEIKIAGAS